MIGNPVYDVVVFEPGSRLATDAGEEPSLFSHQAIKQQHALTEVARVKIYQYLDSKRPYYISSMAHSRWKGHTGLSSLLETPNDGEGGQKEKALSVQEWSGTHILISGSCFHGLHSSIVQPSYRSISRPWFSGHNAVRRWDHGAIHTLCSEPSLGTVRD